jgi:hypothetical protein
MTPDEVAEDYNVPVAAVLEVIHHSVQYGALLQREREKDWDESHARDVVESPPLTSGS